MKKASLAETTLQVKILSLSKIFYMKTLFATVFYSLVFLTSKAQNNYVEVSVTDTVLALANQFTFHVMAMPDAMMETDSAPPSRMDYMRRESEMRARQKQMLDELELRLKASGFSVAPTGIQDMMASRGYGNYYLVYQIQSVDDLKKFQTVLKNEKQVHTILQNATTNQEAAHQKRLYSKLLEKAKTRAEYLANISGKKINSIISITDHVAADYGMHPYATTSVTRVSEEQSNINTNYPINGRLIVRFSWN